MIARSEYAESDDGKGNAVNAGRSKQAGRSKGHSLRATPAILHRAGHEREGKLALAVKVKGGFIRSPDLPVIEQAESSRRRVWGFVDCDIPDIKHRR